MIDPYGIIQLRIWLNFAGILLGWFAFYFLIGALKNIEDFTKKKTGWKLIYLSLPFLLILPIAEIHSYYVLGQSLGEVDRIVSGTLFVFSSLLLFAAVYGFKKHLGFKMLLRTPMALALFLFFVSALTMASRVPEPNAFIYSVLSLTAFYFFALSLWVIGSYTKEFNTVFPVSDFFLTASILLLIGQLVHGFAVANKFVAPQAFLSLDFTSVIFFFLGLLIAAISTYVFKKTVIEFSFNSAHAAKIRRIKL